MSSSNTLQANENADDLVAKKKEIDAQVEEKRKEAKEYGVAVRAKASTAGNIVGKAVPVSTTEVSHPPPHSQNPNLSEPHPRTITRSFELGTLTVQMPPLRKSPESSPTMKSSSG